MKALLVLDEKYTNFVLAIDVTTFSWGGNTTGYEWPASETKEDSYIGFILIDHENTETVCNKLKTALKLNVDKEDYVRVRVPQLWDMDQRVRLSLRLSAGGMGLANPSSFTIRSPYQFTIKVDGQVVHSSVDEKGFDTAQLAKQAGDDLVNAMELSKHSCIITVF